MQSETNITTLPPTQESFLRSWLNPKSLDRDERFRERSIRIAILLVTAAGLLSMFLSVVVFRDEWTLISAPTILIVTLAGFALSAVAITKGNTYVAAWLIVISIYVAIAGTTYFLAQQNDTSGVFSGALELLITLIIAALVLPRKYLIPLSLFSTALFGGLLILFEANNFQLQGINIVRATIANFVIFVSSALVLDRLRREFDERLDAVQESFRATEEARRIAEEARQQAEDADRAKTQFLANMSHELRTPLNATIGYSEAMLGGMAGEFSEPQRELLGHIQFNSRRLLSLINDILDLSKVESGSLQVYLSPMSPSKLITQTAESLRSLAQEKHIDLNVKLDDSTPEIVLGDYKKLEQILTNLLSNAIKFTDRGQVTVSVSGDEQAETGFWKFSVQDTGVGMPSNAAEYIFDPFRQVDNSSTRKHKGTGLGLSITKKMIDHLDGTISVETAEGKGTCFTVSLPKAAIPTVAD